MTVNGLKLPDAFVALVDRPDPRTLWTPKGGHEGWVYKGGENGVYWVQISPPDPDADLDDLQLCRSLAEVEEETHRLPVTFRVATYTPEGEAEAVAYWGDQPGFLPYITDFSQIVYFGVNGGAEAYCFDYRENQDEPSIIHWNSGYWRRFSPNFDAFMSMFRENKGAAELDDGDS